MKSILLISMAFSVSALQAETIGLWKFEDGATGTPATVLTNSVAADSYPAIVKQGATSEFPVFSDDVPGFYLYDSQSCTNLLTDNLKSIQVPKTENNGRIWASIAGLPQLLSTLESFTIEFYARAETENLWRTAFSIDSLDYDFKLSIPGAGKSYATLQNDAYNVIAREVQYNLNTAFMKPKLWRHYAVVYRRNQEKLELFINQQLQGNVTLQYAPTPETKEMKLWASVNSHENFIGKMACLRISDRALGTNEFLRATFSKKTDEGRDHGNRFVLWAFDEKVPGEAVTEISDTTRDPQFTATPIANKGGFLAGEYSAEAPGRYIWPNASAAAPIVTNVQSLLFHANGKTNGCYFSFPMVADMLQDLDEYTIEVFYRPANSDKQTWRPLLSHGENPRPRWKFNAPGSHLDSVNIQTYNWNPETEKEVSSYLDIKPKRGLNGKWHHVAVVFSQAKAKVELYNDYRKINESQIQRGARQLNGSAFFRLGRSSEGWEEVNFDGNVAAMRISPRALSIQDFMVAANSEPAAREYRDVPFHFTFDGLGLRPGSPLGKFSCLPELKESSFGEVARENCSSGPAFSDQHRKDSFLIYQGETLLHTNSGAVRVEGWQKEGDHVWAGQRVLYPGARLTEDGKGRELTEFTCEMMLRSDPVWANADSSIQKLLMGKSANQVPPIRHYVGQQWRITQQQKGGLLLSMHLYDPTEGGTATKEVHIPTTDPSIDLTDGRWHHLACTYDGKMKRWEVFYDYRSVITYTHSLPLYSYPLGDYSFGRGCAATGFDGYFDEIRLTERVLKPEAFLRAGPSIGSILLLK